jgi:small nuclear ribonucleoprotein (snRNP)-like protein
MAAAATIVSDAAAAPVPEMNQNVRPSDVLRNAVASKGAAARDATACVELRDGVSLVGTLVSADGWMNLVMTGVQRYSADGTTQWKVPHVVLRGSAVRTIRVQPGVVRPRPTSILHPPTPHPSAPGAAAFRPRHAGAPGGVRHPLAGGGGGRPGGAPHQYNAGARRPREGEAGGAPGPARPKLTADERSKKFAPRRP